MVSSQKQEVSGTKISKTAYYRCIYRRLYCEELRLIIEVDGSVHDNLGQNNYDFERQQYLKSLGYYVYRVDNDAVNGFMGNVLEDLALVVDKIKTLTLNPSTTGEG